MNKFIFRNKAIFVLFLVFIFTLGNIVGASADTYLKEISAFLDYEIRISIHGKEFTPKDSNGNKIAPITYNGTTYLPVRAISEAIGLNVQWDDKNRMIKLGNFITDENGKQLVVMKSPDGRYQLLFNDNWKKDNTLKLGNPSIDLGVMSNNRYTAVVVEDKEDYHINLNDYTNLIISEMEYEFDSSKAGVIKDLQINGCQAKQLEFHVLYQSINISYLITIIETNSKYYQILSWTSQNKFNNSKKEFDEIANSFKELIE